jgi:uncharacterized repeat protein (TIGR03803 family)
MTKLSTSTTICAVFLFYAATASDAQTFNTLVNFDGTNGGMPDYVKLEQGADGNLYGTTQGGGTLGKGTVFNITPEGTLTTLANFQFLGDGYEPQAGVILGNDGNYYGTTIYGGDYNVGTFFRVTPAGVQTTFYSFCGEPNCTTGEYPISPVVLASNGNFYGTTLDTIFRITPDDILTTLQTNLSQPIGALVQGADGNVYGTTFLGGDLNCDPGYGCGTIFKMTLAGNLTIIHTFEGTDGTEPIGGLIQATDGKFYGTTSSGGPDNLGTIFRISSAGTFTSVYAFSGPDGSIPNGVLLQGTDGSLYGTTQRGGGSTNAGTVFKIDRQGNLTTLISFGGFNGQNPLGGLVQHTNGTFYGTTQNGGTDGGGTIFSLSTGLSPFVTFVFGAAKEGQTAQILGQGFTGSTNVAFNGDSAAFTIVSDTFIKAVVPAKATTGYVTVTTPSGVLTSNVPFHVLP